jgi:hypothetical protein
MVALLGWDKGGAHLCRYLAQGVNSELQMGAVSGLVDVDHPAATKALINALDHLSEGNRVLAIDGLLRNNARKTALQSALNDGTVKPDDMILGKIKQSRN